MNPDGKSTGSTTLLAREESWAESTDDIWLIASCPLEAFHEEAQKKGSWEAAPYGAAQESVHVDDFIAAQSGTKAQWETAKMAKRDESDHDDDFSPRRQETTTKTSRCHLCHIFFFRAAFYCCCKQKFGSLLFSFFPPFLGSVLLPYFWK
jgi:hypothetical protein